MSGPQFVDLAVGVVLLAGAVAPVTRWLWRRHSAGAGGALEQERMRLEGEALTILRTACYLFLVAACMVVAGTMERRIAPENYGPGWTEAVHAGGWVLYAAAVGAVVMGAKALSTAVALLRKRADLGRPEV